MESRKVRRKSSQVTLLSALLHYRERLARSFLQTSEWLWHLCLVFNPYSLWKSEEFWAKCVMWYCALESRLSAKAAERLRILDWVRSKVTRVRPPYNFTSDWRDGILLCALLEALVPGSCPRFDLLNPDNAASNTQMAMKLIERHLGLKPSMSAEELVECGPGTERKLMVLIAQLKLAAAKSMLRKTVALPIIQGADDNNDTFFNSNQECVAKGMGLVLAMKGRKATFNIYLKSTTNLNIVIEIRGPGNSICSERITNRSPKRKTPIKAGIVAAMCFTDRGSKLSRSNSSLNSLGEGDETGLQPVKIPFEYEVMYGKVSVGFIPVSIGKHRLSIIWQGQHIMGSPYIVSVDESSDCLLDIKPKPPKRGLTPFGRLDNRESILGTPPASPAISFHQSVDSPVTMPDSSKPVRKLGNVTRRRVLRHIVQVDGKDMVIEESTPEQFALAVQALRKTDAAPLDKRALNRQFSLDAQWDQRNVHSQSFAPINETATRAEKSGDIQTDRKKKVSLETPGIERSTSTPEIARRHKSDTSVPRLKYDRYRASCDSPPQRKDKYSPGNLSIDTDFSLSMSSGLNSEDCSGFKTPELLENPSCEGSEQNREVISKEFPFEDRSKEQVEVIKVNNQEYFSAQSRDVDSNVVFERTPSPEEVSSEEWLVVSVDEEKNSSIEIIRHPVTSSDAEYFPNPFTFDQVPTVEKGASLNCDIEPDEPLNCDIEPKDACSISSVGDRNFFFESLSKETNVAFSSPLASPARSVDNVCSVRTTPIRSYSDNLSAPASLPCDVSKPSRVFSTSYRSQSLGSLTGPVETQGTSFSFLKVKEFWERGKRTEEVKLVQIMEQEVPVDDPKPINFELCSSVRDKMNFWKTLTGSPAKEKRASYALTSKNQDKNSCSEKRPPPKSRHEEPGGARLDSETVTAVASQVDLSNSPDQRHADSRTGLFRLGSPGSEGTQDSGVYFQEPVVKEPRPRSYSVPCAPKGFETMNFRSRANLGTPLTLIYRNNPLFSLDTSQGHFGLLDDTSTAGTSVTELTDDRGYIDDEIPDYASMLMDKYVSFTGLLENDRRLSRKELLSFDFIPESETGASPFQDTLLQNETIPLLPRANVCRAYGAGVYYGQVGLKNHFQVRTRGAGKGCLTVSVQGPGQHDVNEVVLAYAGDHTYEILYDVSEPGYYIISVKWSEWNIPDSPFICKVTF